MVNFNIGLEFVLFDNIATNMAKQQPPKEPPEIPQPEKHPEIERPGNPEGPAIPAEEPGFVPFENPFEVPPIEIPPPGEGF